MDQCHPANVGIRPPVAQVDDGRVRLDAQVLQQDGGLLQLLGQRVAVIGVARQAARTDHQALFGAHRHADLHAELVGLAGLALADALDLRRMQRVQLVLVLGALRADALATLQPWLQAITHVLRRLQQAALHVAQHAPEHGALALEHPAQPLELLGVRIAAGTPAQAAALALEGLLQPQPGALRQLHHLGPRHFQQPAVGGIGHRLLLHRGVHDHTLQFALAHRLHLHGRLDRLGQQLLQAGIARGYYDEEQFRAYTRWVHARFAEEGAPLLATYYCPHHPEAGQGAYKVACSCRKPEPGMLLAAIERFRIDPAGSWMLGDNDSDLQAAAAAGVAGLWRLRPGTPLGELTAALASAVSPEGNGRAGGTVLKLRGFFPCP